MTILPILLVSLLQSTIILHKEINWWFDIHIHSIRLNCIKINLFAQCSQIFVTTFTAWGRIFRYIIIKQRGCTRRPADV